MIKRAWVLVPTLLVGTLVLAVKLVTKVTVTRRTTIPAQTLAAITCRDRWPGLERRRTCFDLSGAMLLTVALGPKARIFPGAPCCAILVGGRAHLRRRLIDVPTSLVVDLVASVSIPHLVEDGPLQIVCEAGEMSEVENDQPRRSVSVGQPVDRHDQ
jgi:hypothetical protein